MGARWARMLRLGGGVAVGLCLGLSCSDSSTSPEPDTGPGGPSAPTEAQLQGRWLGVNYEVDIDYASADTYSIDDSSALLMVTADTFYWVETGTQGVPCYCDDPIAYEGMRGDTVLGDDMTGRAVGVGYDWTWTTTAAMRDTQLVVTNSILSRGYFSYGGDGYTSDTLVVYTSVYVPYGGAVPPAGLPECALCDLFWKRQSEPSIESGLRKATGTSAVTGTWREIEYVAYMRVNTRITVTTDTMVAVQFTADSSALFEMPLDWQATCRLEARDTLGLNDTTLLGAAFTGTFHQQNQDAQWWTSLAIKGDSLYLHSLTEGTARTASAGHSSVETGTYIRRATLVSTVNDVPPASWPDAGCASIWWQAILGF